MKFQVLKDHILKSEALNDKIQVYIIKLLLEKGGYADKNNILEHLNKQFSDMREELLTKAINALVTQGVLFVNNKDREQVCLCDSYNYTRDEKEDLILVCINRISSFTKDPQFFLAIDKWSKWEDSLEAEKFLVGFDESRSAEEFQLANENDILFFGTVGFAPPSKRGIFGVGKILRKYVEHTRPYWKQEKASSCVLFKNRMEIQPLKIASTEEETVYAQKFKPEKRIIHIKDMELLHKIIKETETKWKIKFWTKKK